MKYKEWTEARQEEFNQLPIFYAFSNEQFEKALAERGIKVEEAGQYIYKLGDTGGFYLKEDAEAVRKVLGKDTYKELREMMEKDLDFAYEAFEYEMYNHEYPINWEGDYDVCRCFGNIKWGESKYGSDYLRELGFSEKVIAKYYQAKEAVVKGTEW